MEKFDLFITFLTTLMGSAAFFSFVTFLITRRDKKKDRTDAIEKKIDLLTAREDERDARMSRSNILRFEDEIENGLKHSRESFRNIFEDMDRYEAYCSEHTNFRNSYTVEASAHIKHVYVRLMESGEFKIMEVVE